MLNRVTMTGADDSIRPEQLIPLTQQYPFVEWAILLSESSEGNPRYPSKEWLQDLYSVNKEYKLPLAGHICGAWVRDLVTKKSLKVFEDRPEFLEMFPRIQLNFSPYQAAQLFLDLLKPFKNEFIFQIGSKWKTDKEILLQLGLDMGLNLSVLFDRSGGKGLLPEDWPQILDPFYCGYAGGLGPDSLADQIPKILQVVDKKLFWIDMESRIRSEDNLIFDLEKVRACLEIAQPWVI
jgi:hypothetical protein